MKKLHVPNFGCNSTRINEQMKHVIFRFTCRRLSRNCTSLYNTGIGIDYCGKVGKKSLFSRTTTVQAIESLR